MPDRDDGADRNEAQDSEMERKIRRAKEKLMFSWLYFITERDDLQCEEGLKSHSHLVLVPPHLVNRLFLNWC